MQTRDVQEHRAGLVTAERPEPARINIDAAQPQGRVEPQLQAALNLIPAHSCYAKASGVLLSPIIVGAAMSLSSASVIGYALRLRRAAL